MASPVSLGSRISGVRLVPLLGHWRRGGGRQVAGDLAAAVRLLILDGRLPAGTVLPAERELAGVLRVSRTTVTTAMDRLRADGFAASRRGAGTWVTLPAGPAQSSWLPGDRPDVLDLAQAAPAAPPGLAGVLDRARLRLPEQLGRHGYFPQGVPELRCRVADRLTARGLPTDPDQVLITNGAQHAWALVLRLVVVPGDRVLVEHPTYPNSLLAIRAAHALPVPFGLADELWCPEDVEAALRQAAPRLAYFIVDFQNPTGLRLDAAGRERLGTALRRNRTLAVADETLVELDLEGDPLAGPPPLAAFGEDNVITIGSASKTFWGGLRIGWIRASRDLLNRLLSARAALDLGSSVFDQLVTSELLADPEPMLAGRRTAYRQQRDAAVAAVREYCPEWSFRLPAGGLSLWCDLGAPISTRLAVAAESMGVRIAPGPRFAVHGGLERRLRLPYALPSEQLTEAVRRLGQAAAGLADGRLAADAELAVDRPVV